MPSSPPVPSAPVASAPVPSAPVASAPVAPPMSTLKEPLLPKQPTKSSGKAGAKVGAKKEQKLSEEIKDNLDKIKFQNLWKLVNIKSVISEIIWFLLCGVLVLAFSYNAILNLSCSHSLEQQEILQKEGDEKLEKLMKEIDES